MTPYEIESKLEFLSQALSEATSAATDARREWQRKDDAYRSVKARAFLEADGTVDARRAKVDLACEVERIAAHAALAEWDACKLKLEQIDRQISTLQTIAKFTLAEFQMQSVGTPPTEARNFPF